jgi:hypothetical protein
VFPNPSLGTCPAQYYTITFTAMEMGYSGNFTAVSANTTEVTVSPTTSTGAFTLTAPMLAAGSAQPAPTSIHVTDTMGNSANLPVTFNEVCL